MIGRVAAKLESMALRMIRLQNKYPPLFIVGAPRGGTTLVYLHIVNSLKFGYFPNASKAYPRACISAALWSQLRHSHTPNYENHYGNSDGPLAPSDGWDIFHRWFPKYDYSQSVDTKQLYKLKTIIRAFEIMFQAPFANKNNSNSVRIEYLNRLFPDAFYIHVKRNPVDTILSLLEGRKRHGIPLDEWWSAAPPQFYTQQFDSEVERVVYQIWGVTRFIEQSLEPIDSARWTQVTYEEFCMEPNAVLGWLDSRYAQAGVDLEKRQVTLPAQFQQSSKAANAQNSETTEKISEILNRLEKMPV